MIYDKDTLMPIGYSSEERQSALKVSLTALAKSMGYTPIRNGCHYILKEMDSLVIYNDRSWNRWSQKGTINGGTQIDFLLEFGGVDNVAQAIEKLLNFTGGKYIIPDKAENGVLRETNNKHSLELPPKNKDYKRTYAYLMKTRGLSQSVISDFIHRKLIYEDAIHHNLVFCGYDPEGNIRYAGLRGTADAYGKKFKIDAPGNDKNYGVNIVNKNSNMLVVFESVIDCMSYIDICHDNESNKLILGMVEDNPLQQFLKDYNHIEQIKFCLDNDEAGHKAIYGCWNKDGNLIKEGLIRKYEALGYNIWISFPPAGKDWNEYLVRIKNKQQLRIKGNGR